MMDNGTETPSSQKGRIGEILFSAGCLSLEQLDRALKVQKKTGGRIGEVLLELGLISSSSLVSALREKYLTLSADLYDIELTSHLLSLLPFEVMKKFEVLPLALGTNQVFLAMTDPRNVNTINELSFYLGQEIKPVVVPSAQIKAVLSILEMNPGKIDQSLKIKDPRVHKAEAAISTSLPSLPELCKHLVKEKASDLLMSAGAPHSLKRNGELVRLPYQILTPQQMTEYSNTLISESQRAEFERTRNLDFTHVFPEVGRFRINIFRQRNTISISIRHIVETVPTLATLGLPDWLGEFALRPYGLILISGPTGNGKTTTMAALVDLINSNKRCNIITIEDPIEYHHRHKLSNVNQREVGIDISSYSEGLKQVFRQSPDVIVVGEIRDPESAAIAIQAASSGHLVMTTLHANNATATIERIIEIFPHDEQQQIRTQLANNLLLVLNQRLIQTPKSGKVTLAYEKLINSQRVKIRIRDGKLQQIRGMYQQSSDDYQSLDLSLVKLCREGEISQENAVKLCENPSLLRELLAKSEV